MKEKFKEMLFNALYEASKVEKENPLFQIGRNVLTGFDGIDLRVFMDSEMQSLIHKRPYLATYIISESDFNTLTFLDNSPIVKEYGNAVDIIYNYYDVDSKKVKQVVTKVYLKNI